MRVALFRNRAVRIAACVWLCLETEQLSNASSYPTYSTNLKLSVKVLDFVQFGGWATPPASIARGA